jgi:hypothetical protein
MITPLIPLLAVESDASHLSVAKGRFRVARLFYLANKQSTLSSAFKPSGIVHVMCHIMRKAISSAVEAELGGALFHNGKWGISNQQLS